MAWKQSDRDRQKWNYQVYRKMDYGPKIARKMRNRSPEKTLYHIHTEVKRQHEQKYKKPLQKKHFPKMPRTLITKTRRANLVDWIVDNIGLTRKQASRYNRMSLEKFRIMKERTNSFTDYVIREGAALKPGKKYKRRDVLKEIQEMMKAPTVKDFFKALRAYYRTVVGVPPDGISKFNPEKTASKQTGKQKNKSVRGGHRNPKRRGQS